MSRMSERPSPTTVIGSDRVEVSVPLRTEFLSTVRTVAAALGADAGFSIDEIDDLRLAISEVVSSFVEADQQGDRDSDDRIDVAFGIDSDTLTVEITTRRGKIPVDLDDLAAGILGSVVDRCDISTHTVHLAKRADEAADAEAVSDTSSAMDA